MANYKDMYNKFDIARELLVNRYMLNTLLVNINNLCYYLEGKEKAVRALLPEDTKKRLRNTIKYQDVIEFDRFEISSRYYNALSNKFGYESVSNASIILDDYIKLHPEKVFSQSTINKKLREYCERCKVIINTKEYLAEAVKKSNQLDYKMIDNEAVARQYIASIPYYLRTVNEGCKYLRDKFNLG